MSKVSTRRKKTKKRKVKTTPPHERLYKRICSTSGVDLPKFLASEKYLPLLKHAHNGYLNPGRLMYLTEEEPLWVSKVGDLFPQTDSGLPFEFSFGLFCVDSLSLEDDKGMAIRRGKNITLLGYRGNRYELPESWDVTAIKPRTAEMPADMREWAAEQRIQFLRFKNEDVQLSPVMDNTRSPSGLIRKPMLERLHKIRRINTYPSKAQRRRIDREVRTKDLRKHSLTGQFSLDQ